MGGSGSALGGAVSGFGGVVFDANGNMGVYYGGGWGLAVGAGAVIGPQIGFSNGNGINAISGPFVDIGGGGGAGAAGAVNYFGGWTDGQFVQGGYASIGAGFGGSASGGFTFTQVIPIGTPSCR